MSPAEAFLDLCGVCPPYPSDAGGPKPYDKELVSSPRIGASPLPGDEYLSPVHRDLVVGDRASMLDSPDEIVAAMERSSHAYVDPACTLPSSCLSTGVV